MKSACDASLTVRERRERSLPGSVHAGQFGELQDIQSGLLEELLLSRNEPALVSLFNPDIDGV